MNIGLGAEAVVRLEDGHVVKERVPKSYRIKEIDDKLRKLRTRRESKILGKLSLFNFPSPKLISMSERDMTIKMEFLKGEKLRDCLYKDPMGMGREIGCNIGILHQKNIIHGDLTTSNMIKSNKVNFIDFGLSTHSKKIEDKAVDMHLFKQNLESKHHTFWEQCFNEVVRGYHESFDNSESVLEQLKIVESRGRNKH